jgi:TonB family protein
MGSRIIQIIVLALVFALASPAAVALAEGEKAAFRAAYKTYQEAVEAGDAEAIVTTAEEALDLGDAVFSDDSPSLAALHINFGEALLNAKQAGEAIKPLKEGIKRFEALYGKDDARLMDPLFWLVQASRGDVQGDDHIPLVRRFLKLVTLHHGEDSLSYADANLELGRAHYFSFSTQRRASRYFRDSYDAYARVYGQPAYKTGVAALWMGKAAQQNGRRAKAEEFYLDALRIFEETSPPGHKLQLQVHAFLIGLYEDRGKSEEATLHCQAISRLRPLAGVDGFQPLYKKYPVYPGSARAAAREGFVLVEFTVTSSGMVANASVIESKGGRAFERAAMKAVEGFRYAPAVQDGELVETTGVRNLITFKIAD